MNPTNEENRDIGPNDLIQNVILDVQNEKEQFEIKKNSKTLEFLARVSFYIFFGCSFSVFSFFFLVPSARAATSSSSASTSSSGRQTLSTQLSPSHSKEITNFNQPSPSRPPIPRSDSYPELELRFSKSIFLYGTPLRDKQKIKTQLRSQSTIIKASQGQRWIEPQADVIPLVKPAIKIISNVFKKKSMFQNNKFDMDKILTNPRVLTILSDNCEELIDCSLSIKEERERLEYGLSRFCNYKHVNKLKTFTENEVEIFRQEAFASSSILLRTDFKGMDSRINKIKNKLNRLKKHRLSQFYDAGENAFARRERYLLFQRGEEDAFKELKNSLADDIEALSDDFVKGPQFYLTLRVYSEASNYLNEKCTQIKDLFSTKLNTSYLDINPLLKFQRANTNRSFQLVNEASAEAISLIESDNLVRYYNRKNPGQPLYEQAYEIETGRKPQVPYNRNRHKLASASIESAFSTAESNTNEGEGGFV